MTGHLVQRVTALEATAGTVACMPFVLFGDEPVPDGCDERKIVRIPWLSVDVARARGWR